MLTTHPVVIGEETPRSRRCDRNGYISRRGWSVTGRCSRPRTSSFAGTLVSCQNCCTHPLHLSSFFSPSKPVSSHNAAAVSDEASRPAEHQWSPLPRSLWQPVTCMASPIPPPSHHSLPLSSFAVSLSFPQLFFFLNKKAKPGERAVDRHAPACDSPAALHSLSLHLLVSPSSSVLSLWSCPVHSILPFPC